MSYDLKDIRTALVLPGTDLNVYESISGAQSLPFAVLGDPDKNTYNKKNYTGTAEVELPLWVVVSRSDDTSARRALDKATAIGKPGSVYDAIRALADVVDAPWRTVTCLSHGPYGTTTFNKQPALAVAFNLTITA